MSSLARQLSTTMTLHQPLVLSAKERNEKWLGDVNNCWLSAPTVDISIFAPQIGHWSETREITVRIAKSTQADHFYRPVVEPMADHLDIVNTELPCPGHQLSKFLPAKLEERMNFSFPSNQQLSVWDGTGGNSSLAQVHQHTDHPGEQNVLHQPSNHRPLHGTEFLHDWYRISIFLPH